MAPAARAHGDREIEPENVMSNWKTIATWAEGFSWLGPGGTWFDIQS